MQNEKAIKGDFSRSIHLGESRQKPDKSLTQPITQTATFVFDTLDEFESFKAGERENYEYGRYGNPTVRAAEKKLAALDKAEEALLFPSGMNAITSMILAMLRSGQHLILMHDCYRMTVKFTHYIEKFGIESTVVEPGDVEGLDAAVQKNTRLLFIESPTNPHLHVVDLEKLVAFGKSHRIKVAIDSTFATPVNQCPMDFGIDLVIHSATKYLGGHNDLMAGSISGNGGIIAALKEYRNMAGATIDPQSAYLLIRGMKTLTLRVRHQNASALALARFLEGHEKIEKVYYPGLASHPDFIIAQSQMQGYGGLVSFDIKGDLEQTRKFVHHLEIPYLAPSLGGVESLVSHPATVSYYDLSREERLKIGIKDQLVRYAVGCEDASELISDINQALNAL